jgi:hypothetical protein
MNHRQSSTQHSIANDFFTFGNDGIGLHHAAERRVAERERNRLATHQPHRVGAFRRRLGALLIAAGQDIRGECMPAPQASGVRG